MSWGAASERVPDWDVGFHWADPLAIAWSGSAKAAEVYDPAQDAWRPVATEGAPPGRAGGAVVAGAELFVWGAREGEEWRGVGGRYDPRADRWLPVSTEGAPGKPDRLSLVWTGSEVIAWGGSAGGGRYHPSTDRWSGMSAIGAPATAGDAALWTGSEVIVWDRLGESGRYDPVGDVWMPMRPSDHGWDAAYNAAYYVWTGSEMLVAFGGDAVLWERYDPALDRWRPMSGTGARRGSRVWTGSEMIVVARDGGARYDPAGDVWSPILVGTASPAPRSRPQVFWTGSMLVVWGGIGKNDFERTGGRYCPATERWWPTSTNGAPAGGEAVWTGSEMIVWQQGAPGGRYDPTADVWRPIEPAPTRGPGVWAGSELILWDGGGRGARWDATADRWSALPEDGAPGGRSRHSLVWTGSEAIAWGGEDGDYEQLTSGGRYDPVADRWTPTSQAGAPPLRRHLASWTGSEMIVWRDFPGEPCEPPAPCGGAGNGAAYHPAADAWRGIEGPEFHPCLEEQAAVWTGSELFLWGGYDAGCDDCEERHYDTGARYDPLSVLWRTISSRGSPGPRAYAGAAWTGSELIVWGGGWDGEFGDGGRYRPGP